MKSSNSILEGDRVVDERIAWRPHPDSPREDVHHLNSICRSNGRVLVSGLGRKAGGTWGSARDGAIWDVEADDDVLTALNHPHSLSPIGESLLFCESRAGLIRTLDGSASSALGGYTRGIAVAPEHVFVGVSRGRLVSKSTGGVENPAAGGAPAGTCLIYRLTLDSLLTQETVPAGAFGREIYDLIPLEGTEAWPRLQASDWLPRSADELWSAYEHATARAIRSEGDTSQIRATVDEHAEALQAKASELARLVAELDQASKAADTAARQVQSERERNERMTRRARGGCGPRRLRPVWSSRQRVSGRASMRRKWRGSVASWRKPPPPTQRC